MDGVVVFGDSDWIKNINFAVYHNRDLVLNAFNWLSGDDAAIAIHPVSRVVRQIPIPFSTLLAIGAACFIIPEILLLFGLCVWWSRQGRVPVTV